MYNRIANMFLRVEYIFRSYCSLYALINLLQIISYNFNVVCFMIDSHLHREIIYKCNICYELALHVIKNLNTLL